MKCYYSRLYSNLKSIKLYCVVQFFVDGNLDLDNFGKKKKKKKKVTINLDDLESALPDTSSAMENGDGQDAMDVSFIVSIVYHAMFNSILYLLSLWLQDDFDLDMDFSKTKKKKKKKKDIDELVAEDNEKKGDKFDDSKYF